MDLRAVVSVVFVVCASCGGGNDGSNPLMDAPVGSTPDAPVPDALPPNAVKVTLTLGGAAVAGQMVYFQQADSTMVGMATTDGTGMAGALVSAGGFVTVVEPEQPSAGLAPITFSTHLTTFADVQPGDDLHLDLAPLSVAPAPTVFTLMFPNEQLDRHYVLYAPCVTGTLPIDLGVGSSTGSAMMMTSVSLAGCGATTDLMVVGQGDHRSPLSWIYQSGVAISAGASITLAGPFQQTAAINVSVNNVMPTGTTLIDTLGIRRWLRSARGQVYFGDEIPGSVTSGMAQLATNAPNPAGLLRTTLIENFSGTEFNAESLYVWGVDELPATMDYSSTMLRRLMTKPVFDAASHSISWTETATGTSSDLVLARFTAQRTDDVGVHTWSWRIAAPSAAAPLHITYPSLSATSFNFNVAAGDSLAIDQLLTASLTDAHPYQTLLPKVFLGTPTASAMILATETAGTSGQLKFNEFRPQAAGSP